MNNNKETERAELHKTIWRIANDLRGSVDGWDFKTYVLGMLFYRFISENLTSYLNEQERKAGTPDFDYARLTLQRNLFLDTFQFHLLSPVRKVRPMISLLGPSNKPDHHFNIKGPHRQDCS